MMNLLPHFVWRRRERKRKDGAEEAERSSNWIEKYLMEEMTGISEQKGRKADTELQIGLGGEKGREGDKWKKDCGWS